MRAVRRMAAAANATGPPPGTILGGGRRRAKGRSGAFVLKRLYKSNNASSRLELGAPQCPSSPDDRRPPSPQRPCNRKADAFV